MAKYVGVSQNADGSWTYRIKVKLPNGNVKDTRIKKDEKGNPFLTAKQAFNAKKEHEARIKANPEQNAPKNKTITLQNVYDNYLETEAKKKAPATLRKQESMWRNHIAPIFANRDIDTITIIELDTFLVNLYKTKSYKYTEAFLKFFYLLFGHADRMEVINPNRYIRMFITKEKRLTMPKMRQADFEEEEEGAVVYDDEQLKIIEHIFKNEDANLLTAFYLGLYCGLRISECFALRWENIDWKNKTITVNRQLQYEKGIWKLCAVKTLTSVRQILIPSFLQDYLDGYFLKQRKQQGALDKGYKNTERVYDEVSNEWLVGADFVNRKANGELLTTNSMKYYSKKIMEVAKIDFKFHNLRHTYATTCAINNVNLQMLMTMMGHKKIETTRKYYINTENKTLKAKTFSIINNMYSYQSVLPMARLEKDYIETIDSQGRKTRYTKI